jgi:hypothetical protein
LREQAHAGLAAREPWRAGARSRVAGFARMRFMPRFMPRIIPRVIPRIIPRFIPRIIPSRTASTDCA